MQIDAGLAGRLVAEQFPQWAGLPVRAVELSGSDNRSFRLGDELLVRMPSAEGYAAAVAKEQRWLPVLGPQLPLPVPEPVALGRPSGEYPWAWSVYRWIEGEPAPSAGIEDLDAFATDVGSFLAALQRVDATDGPVAGPHSFWRAGPLSSYDGETRAALESLDGVVDTRAATKVWDEALSSTWDADPVWCHGDIAVGNLLMRDGRLAAVIDFGTSAVGDPACDTVLAWTLLEGSSRRAFEEAMPLDDATWARGRGWALWKALITLTPDNPGARRTVDAVLADA